MVNWLKHFLFHKRLIKSPEQQKALDLFKAIKRGGVPTDPMLVNRVARNLGLEISLSAPMEQTIEQIARVLGVKK
jgi:hypothetical protein